MNRFWVFLLFFIVLAAPEAFSQIIAPEPEKVLDVDSVKRDFDSQPYFGLYKDNYFIFGPPIGERVTRKNTNVKFQISVAQRLTKSTLPWGTYLFLFYTQKVFWNVLEKSMPMTDLNFNPGVGLVKPLFVKNRFIGKVGLILEGRCEIPLVEQDLADRQHYDRPQLRGPRKGLDSHS